MSSVAVEITGYLSPAPKNPTRGGVQYQVSKASILPGALLTLLT